MEQNEIIEGNRIVAEFVGATIDADDNAIFILPADGVGLAGCWVPPCRYSYDWQWQIPVYSKAAKALKGHASQNGNDHKLYMRFIDKYGSAIFNNNPAAGFSTLIEMIKFINQLNIKK